MSVYHTNDSTGLLVIIMTATSRLAKAGILQFTDKIGACFRGIRMAFSHEMYISGLFQELPGEAELIVSFSTDQFYSSRRKIPARFSQSSL